MRRHIPWLLASLLALRALVPVGYMLHAPAGGEPLALAFTMSLCPLQNPGLDRSLFETSGTAAGHAGHHGAHHDQHHASGDDDSGGSAVRGFAESCTAWVGSTVALSPASVPRTPHPGLEMLALAGPRSVAIATAFARNHPARAPPLSRI